MRWWRFSRARGNGITGLVIRVALAWLLLLGGLTMFQDHWLYYPDRAPAGAMISERLQAWPDAGDFRGLVAAPQAPPRATAIVFHGNAGNAGHRAYYAAALAPLGLRVVLTEYPGYGPRPGEPGEAEFVVDAIETIDRALAKYGPPLLLIGESLGAGVVAAAVAQRPEHVAALLLITPWDRLETVAAHHFPWLPVSWLLRDRYDSAAHLATFARPVMVVIAEHDGIVPPRFGRALFDALPGPKTLRTIDGADHNDWPNRVDAAWWHSVVATLLGRPPDDAAPGSTP